MTTKISSDTEYSIAPETQELILRLEARHNSIVDQLDTLLTIKDAPIHIGDHVIEPGTEKYIGLLAGIRIAKKLVGKFPLKFLNEN